MLLLRQSSKTTFKEEQEFDLPTDEINMEMPSGSVLERAEDPSLDDGHFFNLRASNPAEVCYMYLHFSNLRPCQTCQEDGGSRGEAGRGKGIPENPQEDGLPEHGQDRSRRCKPAEAGELHQQPNDDLGRGKSHAADSRDEEDGKVAARPGDFRDNNEAGCSENNGKEARLQSYLHILFVMFLLSALRMVERLSTTYDAMDTCCEEFSDLHTRGIVDGWDESLGCSVIYSSFAIIC